MSGMSKVNKPVSSLTKLRVQHSGTLLPAGSNF